MIPSTLLVAALAIGALASPINKANRDVVTDVQYVTLYATVTVDQDAAQTVAAAAETTTAVAQPTEQTSVVTSTTEAETSVVTQAAVGAPAPAPAPAAESATVGSPASTSVEDSNDYSARPLGDAQETWSKPGPEYEAMVLWHHNQHRLNHSVSALTWNDSLAQKAEGWAKNCQWKHSGGGENLGSGGPNPTVSGHISDGWYNGEAYHYDSNYGLANPNGDFEQFGHFTQLVWKDTKSVGCYTYWCGDSDQSRDQALNDWFTVCNYFPAGNYGGEYGDNVLPARQPCMSIVRGDD